MRVSRFTLIELTTVLVIVAMMATIAVPSVLRLAGDAQFDAAARMVSSTLTLARQESICARRRVAVVFPAAGTSLSTCYVKPSGAFDGWTPNQHTAYLPTRGLIDGLYVADGTGGMSAVLPNVTAIQWPDGEDHAAACPAIVFRSAGNVASGTGAPNIVRVIDAVRTSPNTTVQRSDRRHDIEVNSFSGRWRYLD